MNWLTKIFLTVFLKKIIFLFIIFVYIFSYHKINAQEQNLYFNHYTNENGLSQNTGKCIVQDSAGFVWIGTEDGLNRFDGYEFLQFHRNDKKENSLSSNYITKLCVDNKNRLWIATWGGLNCYNQETESFYTYTHQKDKPSGIASNTVRVVFIDSENHLWVGTDKGVDLSKSCLDQVNVCDSLDFLLFSAGEMQNALVDNIINSIAEDGHKNIWIGSNLGLSKIDKKTGSVLKYPLPDAASGNLINEIVADDKGNIWLATDKGLFRFDIADTKYISYANEAFFKENEERNQLLSVLYDKESGLYMGTKNIGLIYYQPANNSFAQFYKKSDKPFSLQNRQAKALLIDKSNNLFVIGLNGLDIAEIKNKPFGLNKCLRVKNKSLLSPNILSVYCQDKTHLWLGFEQQGLALYDRGTKKFKNYLFEKLTKGKQLSVKSIYPANKKQLLIGSRDNGLLVFNTKTGQYKQYTYNDSCGISSNSIFFITKYKKGLYWIATQGGGLNIFNLAKGSFKKYLPVENDKNSLGSAIVTHIFIDSKENVWIATFGGGLNRFNEKTDNFTRYTHNTNNKSSISSDKVTHIFEDSKGTLWVGTADGLNKFNPTKGTFVRYTSKDGLTNDFVYAIQEDDMSNLWISTNYGIFKFNKLNETFTNYDVKSGLQNNEFNINASCKTPDSLLLFGGISGFNLFNPDRIKNSSFIPGIAITSFQMFYEDAKIGKKYNNVVVLNQSINTLDTIFLNYKNNQFSFEFTAFDYTKPSAIKYAVRLKGFNNLWHIVASKKRYVSYTNLSPGTYNLQIKASNADGIWNAKLKSLTIIIKTPFWQTWWFIALLILSFILLSYFIFRLRTLYLIKQKSILEKQVKERTKTIEQKNNLLTNQKEELKLQAEELRSITDQLKDLNISLEKKIESRTTDLNSALGKAEDAQKLISSFLANMSHELRTPMNAISGFSQLISDAQISKENRQKYAEIINTNIDMLLALVENVMDVAKLHTGQYKFIDRTFYLPHLCNEIFTELNNKPLKKKAVEFIYSSKHIPRINIHSDPKAFRHIIFNLLENALKYTETGKVDFSCNCTAKKGKDSVYEPKENCTDSVLSIIVSDTGIGIKKEYQENIFNAFHKVEQNKNKLFRGTGLGLALVKSITNKLFGEIKLESELNKGTKVSISIPLSRKE